LIKKQHSLYIGLEYDFYILVPNFAGWPDY